MVIEIETPKSIEYKFYKSKTLAIKFSVKAAHDAHIAITPAALNAEPKYEIFIGVSYNSKIDVYRNNKLLREVVLHNLLSQTEFRHFWLTFYDRVIVLGIDENPMPVVAVHDQSMFDPTHFGIRTTCEITGFWRVDDDWRGWKHVPPVPSKAGTWVHASGGQIPQNALPAGFDGEEIYIGRVNHPGGAIVPGKVHPSHGVCYVSWDGEEHAFIEYEVLCNCRALWVLTSSPDIPPNAVQGGIDANSIPIYIGRAPHDGTITIGKVHKTRGMLSIPYAGTEFEKSDYEILILH